MTLKQMIKDENLNLRKSKITCKPVQTFVKCSHLHLPPSLCPQNCSALFVGRTSNFIICSPTKPQLCFAYLQPYLDRKITPSKSWFMKVNDTLKYLAAWLFKAKLWMSSRTLVAAYHFIGRLYSSVSINQPCPLYIAFDKCF